MSQPNISPIGIHGSFEQGAALGVLPGVTYFHKFGRNIQIDMATDPEDISDTTGIYAGQPADTTPELIEILCPAGADDVDGNGMKTVRITGLRTVTATEYTSEDIDLDGADTGSADSQLTWYRIIRVAGLTYGSTGSNEGVITARSKTTTAEVFSTIQIGDNQSEIAVFTCPAACVTMIRDMQYKISRAAAAAGNATFQIMHRALAAGGYNTIDPIEIVTNGGGVTLYEHAPLILHAGDDMIVRCQEVTANATIATAHFDCFIMDNSTGIYDNA